MLTDKFFMDPFVPCRTTVR